MAITETCILKSKKLSFNFYLENCHEPLHTPTEASVGGTMLYVSKNLSYEPREDLDSLYCPTLLESTFAEIYLPNTTNIIVGSIYKLLEPLLNKINKQGVHYSWKLLELNSLLKNMKNLLEFIS